jgi:hypothetical protein
LFAVSCTVALLALPVAGRSAGPFDGVDWRAVLAHDSLVSRNTVVRGPNGTPFYDVAHARCGGSFAGANAVVVGDAAEGVEGSTHFMVAAVPLTMGGDVGTTCWLLFRAHEATHFAVVPGSNTLKFLDGVIEAVTEKPGSETGGRATGFYRVRTYQVERSGVRLVDDRTGGG